MFGIILHPRYLYPRPLPFQAKDKHEELFRHLLEFIDELQAFWRLQKLQPPQAFSLHLQQPMPNLPPLKTDENAAATQIKASDWIFGARIWRRLRTM
jgi:hypothetical protein